MINTLLGSDFTDMPSPINSYVSFWNKFKIICKANGLIVAASGMPFKEEPIGENKFNISLPEPIYLQDWPENSASNCKVDIVVSGIEIVDAKTSKIVKSNVSVNYFDASKRASKVLEPKESIHYDYEMPCEPGHPLFHAQLSASLIDSFTRYTIDPPALKHRLKGIRIPTAHISLISVLIGLIADHSQRKEKTVMKEIPDGKKKKKNVPIKVLYAPALEDIIKKIRTDSYPIADCRDLYTKIGIESSSFRSILWYPEFA